MKQMLSMNTLESLLRRRLVPFLRYQIPEDEHEMELMNTVAGWVNAPNVTAFIDFLSALETVNPDGLDSKKQILDQLICWRDEYINANNSAQKIVEAVELCRELGINFADFTKIFAQGRFDQGKFGDPFMIDLVDLIRERGKK